jgi:multidrug efflux pump subunit AcrB
VVVENIHRHRSLTPDEPLSVLIPRAVDEVGGPTMLATFTVIAALLPMATRHTARARSRSPCKASSPAY